eukprot:PhM_4_TR9117/c0_g1_i1/m.30734
MHATVCDRDALTGAATLRPLGVHHLQCLDTVEHLTEHNVLAIKPRRRGRADEELRAVRVGAGVGHGQAAEAGVLAGLTLEALVAELLAINGLAAGSVSVRNVATLTHELGDDAVEDAVLEVQLLAATPNALLPRAQRAEVLRGAGDGIGVQLKDHATRKTAADVHVHEDLGVARGGLRHCLWDRRDGGGRGGGRLLLGSGITATARGLALTHRLRDSLNGGVLLDGHDAALRQQRDAAARGAYHAVLVWLGGLGDAAAAEGAAARQCDGVVEDVRAFGARDGIRDVGRGRAAGGAGTTFFLASTLHTLRIGSGHFLSGKLKVRGVVGGSQ